MSSAGVRGDSGLRMALIWIHYSLILCLEYKITIAGVDLIYKTQEIPFGIANRYLSLYRLFLTTHTHAQCFNIQERRVDIIDVNFMS